MTPLIENLDKMVGDVPAMPIVAQRVMKMMADDRVTNAELGNALATDQAMASRVLQMANSPIFGMRSKVTSISNAVFVLGRSALNGLIITVCTKGLYKKAGQMEQKMWEHSLGAAVISRFLAQKTGIMDADEAFVGGLLHDVGRTALAYNYHAAYERIFEQIQQENLSSQQIIEIEKEEFGYAHNIVGDTVIRKWKLPDIYASIARYHHNQDLELINRQERPKAIALVGLADLITERLGLGMRERNREVDIFSNFYNDHFIKLNRESVLDLVEESYRKYRESREQFDF